MLGDWLLGRRIGVRVTNCAPYLAQLRLPDGSHVRPFINHTVQDLTAGDQSWLGYENFGDFASSKAQSTTDTQCLQRTF